MPDTLAALTAAGIVYDRSDFADPHLDGPTALTVTSDGRVYGHLAAAGTCHIGHGDRCVTPPTSKSGYKYFHQGIVPTKDGDLPVGKLTIGTGHAALGQNSVAAAAHYDNTGSVVAAVRAGEDEHGIWLAGRIVPGTPPERVDELRRSGVSGDWRGINGQMELVAALAVNVPGFPVPRTEELVAAGGVATLVAAGVVAPGQEQPLAADDLEAMIASAAEKLVDERFAQQRRRDAVVARVEPLVASAAADRRARVVERVRASLTAGGGRRVRTQEGADRFGVSVGDLIPEAVEQAQQTAGDFAQAAGNDIARLLNPALGKQKAKSKPKAGGSTKPKDETTAKSDSATKSDTATEKEDTKTSSTGTDTATTSTSEPKADTPSSTAETSSTAKTSEPKDDAPKSGTTTGKPADTKPAPAGKSEPASGSSAKPDTAEASAPTKRMEEDESPTASPDGADLLDFSDGVATYTDGSWTDDGTTWHTADELRDGEAAAPAYVGTRDDAAGLAEEDLSQDAFDASDPVANPEAFAETPAPGTEITDTEVPTRIDAGAGTAHPMEEDESPETGAYGGQLVDYVAGVAFYDDGTDTDGTTWRVSEPYEEPDAIAASAARHTKIMRRLGYTVPNRRPKG